MDSFTTPPLGRTGGEATASALPLSFDRMAQAHGYRRWLLDCIRPWLGKHVLEVGCGVGNFTVELSAGRQVVAVDREAAYVDELFRRLGPAPTVRPVVADITDGDGLTNALAGETFDSGLALNVLEHVGDDARALANVAAVITPGAPLVLQVPAHPWAYGRTDEALGHYRRYSLNAVRDLALRADVDLLRMWQINVLGLLGWLVSSRLRQQTMFSSRALRLYEALLPLQRRVEPSGGVPVGLSIMAVVRRRHMRH